MIELKNIYFSYNKSQTLFENLSLKVESGKIYGLLGKNGAGKTTLLKNIAGLSFVKQGTCTVFGMDSAKRDPEMLQNIFFLPEEIWLPDMTASEYEKTYAPSWPDFNHELFSHCMSEFEINPQARLKNMSFGQRKKTAIGFALSTQCKLLILDEPTNGLDIPSKGKFRTLAAEALSEDRSIILSTHQVRDLETLIDTIIILDNSKILLNNTVEEICDKLLFDMIPAFNLPENVLYYELTPRGYSVVMTNPNNEESKIDLELLFNMCTQNPDLAHKLFNI